MFKEVVRKLKNPSNWIATLIIVGVLLAVGAIAKVSGIASRLLSRLRG